MSLMKFLILMLGAFAAIFATILYGQDDTRYLHPGQKAEVPDFWIGKGYAVIMGELITSPYYIFFYGDTTYINHIPLLPHIRGENPQNRGITQEQYKRILMQKRIKERYYNLRKINNMHTIFELLNIRGSGELQVTNVIFSPADGSMGYEINDREWYNITGRDRIIVYEDTLFDTIGPKMSVKKLWGDSIIPTLKAGGMVYFKNNMQIGCIDAETASKLNKIITQIRKCKFTIDTGRQQITKLLDDPISGEEIIRNLASWGEEIPKPMEKGFLMLPKNYILLSMKYIVVRPKSEPSAHTYEVWDNMDSLLAVCYWKTKLPRETNLRMIDPNGRIAFEMHSDLSPIRSPIISNPQPGVWKIMVNTTKDTGAAYPVRVASGVTFEPMVDLSIEESDITIYPRKFQRGVKVQIMAEVHCSDRYYYPIAIADVKCFLGDPEERHQIDQVDHVINLSPGLSVCSSFEFDTKLCEYVSPCRICVVIDPANKFKEYNESNNIVHKEITMSP